MNCPYCSREIVQQVPPNSLGTVICGGMMCGHREVYGLDDCRQVIVMTNSAWGSATVNME